jgi:predicted nucleic acid-binding protein
VLYLDTSALLPFYRQEATSAAVEKLLLAQREAVLISLLSELEVASALARWVRLRELSEAQANRVENAFRDDLRAGRFRLLEPAAGDYARAAEWLLGRKTALRVLDALHMACALRHEAELVSADAGMLRAARHFGLPARRIRA